MARPKKTEDNSLVEIEPKVTKTETQEASWFVTGVDGLKKKKILETSAELRREKNVPRFYLKNGETTTIVFLDSVGFFCLVHQLNISGSWRNFFTCVKDFKPCAICESLRTMANSKEKGSLVYCGHYSIISTQSYTNQQGETVKYFKCLLPAKKQLIDKIADLASRYKDKGGLTGLACKITRYDGEPNCGGTIEPIKKVDLAKQFPEIKDFSPFDYKKVLAPPTEEELEALGFSSGYVVGSPKDVGGVIDELL